jgi:exodeoxyribonuclease VIII
MKPGEYDIMNEKYHHDPVWRKLLSKSGLVDCDKSLYHHFAKVNSFYDETTTPQMALGTLFHLLVLQPWLFDEVAVLYHGVKSGKRWKHFQERMLSHQLAVTPDQIDTLNDMLEGLHRNQKAVELLQLKGEVEKSIVWQDATYGFLCKARIDKLIPQIETVVDLKTCQSAEPEAFSRAIFNYKYHWQARWYLNGMNSFQEDVFYRNFVIIAVENNPPYGTAVYRIEDNALGVAADDIRRILHKYNKAREDKTWSCYPEKVIDITLPAWALK